MPEIPACDSLNFCDSTTDFDFEDSSDRFGQGVKLGNDFYFNSDFIVNRFSSMGPSLSLESSGKVSEDGKFV